MPRIAKAVQEINTLMRHDDLSDFVTNKYTTWRLSRRHWVEDAKELRNYVFQTDTSQTTNKTLPWKNTTSIPKICQLRDNLHANYMAALFPNDNWFKWEAATQDGATLANATLIEAYMKQKIRESEFKRVIGDLLYDYIDYGNAFGEVTYENDVHVTPDGLTVAIYNGPRAHRISPFDLTFDISASSFKSTAKITRRVVSMGTLKHAADIDPAAFAWVEDALQNTVGVRTYLRNYADSDIDKSEGIQIDGFHTLSSYYSSDLIELLEFEGDTFDIRTGEVQTGRRVIVMDRRVVVSDEPFDSWLGTSNKEHVTWRDRPDNLMGMGPLDNLVGMQYRLDHLENLRADVMDQIAHPVIYQKGYVEEWDWGPGERIFGDVDSDVQVLRPDATALNADFQMDRLMRDMEELAGAPREAMGIRTPGEKTAFEVQSLENAAGRIFQQKIQKFEEHLVEPLLNQMLESARRNISGIEVVKVLDEDFGLQKFLTISPEVIGNQGRLYPIGARHFSKQAQLIQNIFGFANSALYQDPAVQTHVSGKKLAKLIEENLGLREFELVQDNIRVAEQKETQSLASQAQEDGAAEILNRQESLDVESELEDSEEIPVDEPT